MKTRYRYYADIAEPGEMDTVTVVAESREAAEQEARLIAGRGVFPHLRSLVNVSDWDVAFLPCGAILFREEALSTCPAQLVNLMARRRTAAAELITRLRNGGNGWDRINLRHHRLAHSALAARLGLARQMKGNTHARVRP